MSRVRHEDTAPEITVRKILHSLGYRFRLHRNDLPGKPDIVLPSRKLAIFVHGCFWHRHFGCPKASVPSSNIEFWREKFQRNVERDKASVSALNDLGWKSIIVWECQTVHDPDRLRRLLTTHIEDGSNPEILDPAMSSKGTHYEKS